MLFSFCILFSIVFLLIFFFFCDPVSHFFPQSPDALADSFLLFHKPFWSLSSFSPNYNWNPGSLFGKPLPLRRNQVPPVVMETARGSGNHVKNRSWVQPTGSWPGPREDTYSWCQSKDAEAQTRGKGPQDNITNTRTECKMQNTREKATS